MATLSTVTITCVSERKGLERLPSPATLTRSALRACTAHPLPVKMSSPRPRIVLQRPSADSARCAWLWVTRSRGHVSGSILWKTTSKFWVSAGLPAMWTCSNRPASLGSPSKPQTTLTTASQVPPSRKASGMTPRLSRTPAPISNTLVRTSPQTRPARPNADSTLMTRPSAQPMRAMNSTLTT